ncbi:peptidase S1 and S6 chymotrypsin/Hap [Chondrocystis sp. NIES-4102]|nr:peptidase S1 and S6 chymotrypsin/Hap [Chondrocystis sp. NIES-4102]
MAIDLTSSSLGISEEEIIEVTPANEESPVIESSAADLLGTSFKAPQISKAGEKITVEYEISNQGNAVAKYFAAGLYLFNKDYLATKSNLSQQDVPEVYFFQGNKDNNLITLLPGQTTKISNELILPSEWKGYSGNGDYYLGLESDPYSEVAESNETNNSLTGATKDYQKITIDAPTNPLADLVVTSFKAPENCKPGSEITVEYEIINKGGAEAKYSAVGFYLFKQDYLDNHHNLSLKDVPEVYFFQGDRDDNLITLAPGASTGINTTKLTIPQNWTGFADGAEYYLGAQADPYDDVTEAIEANNSLTAQGIDYQKFNAADLVGTNFDVVQDKIKPGEKFDIEFTVANKGTVKVDSFEVDLYLSADENISADEDYYLGTYNINDVLDPSKDCGLKTAQYTAPGLNNPLWSKADGMYYAGMIIDPDKKVVELNDNNNSNHGQDLDYSLVEADVAPYLQTTTVHRFYQYQRGTHLYTSDTNEINIVRQRSERGELNYNYEEAKFNVLSSNKDAVTGADIPGTEEVYRFFNRDTGAHLYTMDENEKNVIETQFKNYNYEGVKFYAFKEDPISLGIDAMPVVRMLNTQSGSHLFTIDQNEVSYIENNLPNFNKEANGGVAFYVLDL